MSHIIVVRLCYFEVQNFPGGGEEWLKRVVANHFPDLWYSRGSFSVCLKFREIDITAGNGADLATILDQSILLIDKEIMKDAATLSCIVGRGVAVSVSPSDALWIFYEKSLRAKVEAFYRGASRIGGIEVINPANSLLAKRRLLERPESARLLAEALSAESPAGQIIGFVRVFEAAFRMKHNSLKSALHRFLQSGRTGIPKKLSDSWIEARHGVSHAYDPTRNLFSDDVIKTVSQCRIATFDVVVNKEHWGRNTHSRISPDALSSIVTSSGEMKLTVGHFYMANIAGIDPIGRFQQAKFPAFFGFQWALDIPRFFDLHYGGPGSRNGFEAASPFAADSIQFYAENMREIDEAEKPSVPVYAARPVSWDVKTSDKPGKHS